MRTALVDDEDRSRFFIVQNIERQKGGKTLLCKFLFEFLIYRKKYLPLPTYETTEDTFY